MTDESITKKEFTVLKCTRCGHTWLPMNQEKLPGTCPNPACRSPNWHTPKGQRKKYEWKNPETKNLNRRKAKAI